MPHSECDAMIPETDDQIGTEQYESGGAQSNITLDDNASANQEDTEFKENSEEGMDQEPEKLVLCTSCDRCRNRKTKCDGNRPCASCVMMYTRAQKLASQQGVTADMCGCVYRHAKRRGPVPGSARRSSSVDLLGKRSLSRKKHWFDKDPIQAQIDTLQSKIQAQEFSTGVNFQRYNVEVMNSMQQEMNLLQQLQQQHQQHQLVMNMVGTQQKQPRNSGLTLSSLLGMPKGVKKNLHLLDRNNAEGTRLKSFYSLSVDELFLLPSTPSDEEFFSRKSSTNEISSTAYDQSVLNAARFAELALGALASDQLLLALELSNATVTCLRDCLNSVVPDMSALFLITKSYFLHGLFRSYRGDIARYLKYRRVCLSLIPRLDKDTVGLPALIAAIAFHDSLAYILYNASEDELPDIDDVIPPVIPDTFTNDKQTANEENKTSNLLLCNTITDVDTIVSDPHNQLWMQGIPTIFANNEAPVLNRCLDALACSVRTCCDQANEQYSKMTPLSDSNLQSPCLAPATVTSAAVSANHDELCSRNLVESGYKLFQSHLSSLGSGDSNLGFQMLYLIMSSFMELGNEGEVGFGESQIQKLIKGCKIVIENPLLLFQGGPTYHLVTNAATMLCHVLNDLHATLWNSTQSVDTTLFDEALDTFLAVRTLLVSHRKKIPQILRCHGIPRPSVLRPVKSDSMTDGYEPFIDLGDTFMCRCRGCQGFVLFGCSPCIAAERAKAAKNLLDADLHDNEMEPCEAFYGGDMNEFDRELKEIGTEFDLDDDTLLSILGKIVAS